MVRNSSANDVPPRPWWEVDRPPLGRLGNFIGFRLRRLQHELSRDFADAAADYALRSGFFSTLALIEARPGLSQKELSYEVGIDKSVMVSMINEMERRGYARRERAEEDRRRHALVITEKGCSYLDGLFDILSQTERRVLAALSREERIMLTGLLDRLYHVQIEDGPSNAGEAFP